MVVTGDASLMRVADMLLAAGTARAVLPPTALFNEGWMLRLVLDFFGRQRPSGHPLDVLPGATWRSEALLRSQFEAVTRGDILAESMTHADGVIGHLMAGSGRGDVLPSPQATQFVVVEAKMWSGLAAGTTRAKSFNQAARNVACIAESLARRGEAGCHALRTGFVLLAPAQQITDRVFFDWCDKSHIESVVRARVSAYSSRRDAPKKAAWFTESFLPALAAMQIDVLSWESVIADIMVVAPDTAASLQAFYERCIEFNRPARRTAARD